MTDDGVLKKKKRTPEIGVFFDKPSIGVLYPREQLLFPSKNCLESTLSELAHED